MNAILFDGELFISIKQEKSSRLTRKHAEEAGGQEKEERKANIISTFFSYKPSKHTCT